MFPGEQAPSGPRVFISYAWESESHKAWVRNLAQDLQLAGVDVRIDEQLPLADEISHFIEQQCVLADYVLVICTSAYVDRADGRVGVLGQETRILSAQLMTESAPKCVPVFVDNPTCKLPTYLAGRAGVTLKRRYRTSGGSFQQILARLAAVEQPEARRFPYLAARRVNRSLLLSILIGAAALLVILTWTRWDTPSGDNTSATAVVPATAVPATVDDLPTQPSVGRGGPAALPTATSPPLTPLVVPEEGVDLVVDLADPRIGVWEGQAQRADGDSTYQVAVVVASNMLGEFSVSNGACGGVLANPELSPDTVTWEPRITWGQENCVNGSSVSLSRVTDDVFQYDWAGLNGERGSGSLTRWSQIDVDAQVSWPSDRHDLGSTFSVWVGACLAGNSPPCPPKGLVQDWSACADELCAVGFARDNVQLFRKGPFEYLFFLDSETGHATVHLILKGVPPAMAIAMTS